MIANTNQQSLVSHSFAVGFLATEIFKHFISKASYEDNQKNLNLDIDNTYSYENILNTLFNSGIYHDLGKLDQNFQNYLNEKINKSEELESFDVQISTEKSKFSYEQYPRHQELSWALMKIFDYNKCKAFHQNLLEYIIYWHHAKTFRSFNNQLQFAESKLILENKELDLPVLIKNVNDYLTSIEKLIINKTSFQLMTTNNLIFDQDLLDKTQPIPEFQKANMFSKQSSDDKISFFKNCLNHLLRSILISADRIISKLSKEELNGYIEDNTLKSLILINFEDLENEDLKIGIEQMIINFSKDSSNNVRNQLQETTASQLANINDIAILSGPAGVGKTKIMLQWCLNKKGVKKVYIIAPKTSICFSLYEELKKQYLPNNKIQLITGDLKLQSHNMTETNLIDDEKEIFNCDIIITTIDQILMMMLGHKKIDVFLDVMSSTLIFDEFHEFLEQSAILMLFVQIICIKKMFDSKNCLLVSATPNHFLVKELLNIKSNQNIVKIDSFNEKQYKIKLIDFDDKNAAELDYEMYDKQEPGTILIFNTAQKAQYSAIKANRSGEKDLIVYHSKLLSQDKKNNFNQIKQEFGKYSTIRNSVLHVGPILQASIDISTHTMKTEISNIDNIYQRMGRLNRWGYLENASYYIFIPKSISEKSSKNESIKMLLCRNDNFHSTLAWINFLRKRFISEKQYTLKDLYALYDEFFNSINEKEITLKAYQDDFAQIKVSATKIFSQGFEPVQYPNFIKQNNKQKSLAKVSLRGSSIYTVMLNLNYDKNGNEILTEPLNLKDNLLTKTKDIYFGFEYDKSEQLLEENREQIKKWYHTSSIVKQLYDAIIALPMFSNKAVKISKLTTRLLVDFARKESHPIMLSFKKTYSSNPPSKDDQFYNITYKDVVIGVMKYNEFTKI
jgi:CRISPR-associated endonuclease/helicase Cas3